MDLRTLPQTKQWSYMRAPRFQTRRNTTYPQSWYGRWVMKRVFTLNGWRTFDGMSYLVCITHSIPVSFLLSFLLFFLPSFLFPFFFLCLRNFFSNNIFYSKFVWDQMYRTSQNQRKNKINFFIKIHCWWNKTLPRSILLFFQTFKDSDVCVVIFSGNCS